MGFRRKRIPFDAAPWVLVITAALAAASARADVAPGPRRRAPTLLLRSVDVVRTDAPHTDARAVASAVERALHGQTRRLASCLSDVDLREDPVRGRARRVIGQMRFDRSRRPSVRLERAEGVPAAAQRCLMEVARAVSAPAPRGAVEIRFVYTLR